jgi:hypothetical protein
MDWGGWASLTRSRRNPLALALPLQRRRRISLVQRKAESLGCIAAAACGAFSPLLKRRPQRPGVGRQAWHTKTEASSTQGMTSNGCHLLHCAGSLREIQDAQMRQHAKLFPWFERRAPGSRLIVYPQYHATGTSHVKQKICTWSGLERVIADTQWWTRL